MIRILVAGNAAVVLHDPKPLVRAIGYDSVSVALGRLLIGRDMRIVVHSNVARNDVLSRWRNAPVVRIAHPVLPAEDYRNQPVSRGTIRVLGQYKADRDLDLLRDISAETGGEFSLEITGRGWPEVDGWEVDDRFVSESELSELIRSAKVVVIPYRRFYQSGIAIRCIENGTPVVGLRSEALTELLGAESPLLYGEFADVCQGAGLSRFLSWAAGQGRDEICAVSLRLYRESLQDWKVFLGKFDSARSS
jgi:hypothetical protein